VKRVKARKKPSTAEKITALSEAGVVLLTELDETRLVRFITQTACDVTGAAFAAFSLQPRNDEGQATVPSEGNLFHLAAVVGATPEQEALSRHLLLEEEGLLAPIFRQGVPVLVADVLTFVPPGAPAPSALRDVARLAGQAVALSDVPAEDIPSVGVPPGHPLMRSFLGVPVLDSQGEVRGGLLVGHREPGHFTPEDQALLMGLATQAAVALGKARLSRVAQRRAAVVEGLFASLGDGVTLVDGQRSIVYENAAARQVREQLESTPGGRQALEALLYTPAQHALQQEGVKDVLVQLEDEHREIRAYAVSASLLPLSAVPTGLVSSDPEAMRSSSGEVGIVVIWHDVTERRMREAERQAKAYAEQLEAINEAMADAVFLVDPAGQVVHANAAARRWLMHIPFHLTRSYDAFVAYGLPRDPTVRPLEPAQRPTWRVLNGEILTGNQTVDVLWRTVEGQDLLFNVSGTPVRDGNGKLLGALMIARDVTERRRAEETILEQARQLRRQADLIELAHDAIMVLDPHDVILSWNRGAEALYGWSASRAKGQVIYTLLQTRFPLPQEDLERVLQQEGHWEGELVHTCRDGAQVIVESRQVSVRDEAGRPEAVLKINRDLTERRRLEQVERQTRAEMEDRLNMLRLILDELPDGVYLACGRDARLLLANRATTAIWGATWSPGQPIGEFLAQSGVGLLDMHEQPLVFEQLTTVRAVRHGETTRQFQGIVRQPNGTTLSVLVNAVALDAHRLKLPLLQPGGPPLEEPAYVALVTYQDVTILKEAERLKDQFIGTATHELRNPVAVLRGYTHMLLLQNKRGRWPKLLDRQEEALQSIAQSTTQLVELTEDLLDVTRLQGGGVQLHCQPTDLVALVQRTVEHLQMTTSRHTLTVVTTLPSLVVDADPVRIEQVLSNLIGNAIRYSPEGGPVEITLSEASDAQEARVSIRDRGIGIPEKDQARIFGQFARAGNAETYGIGGTGLGLYLCHELIERHHGRIWFESKEGQGTTFFVALPRACGVTG